MILFHPYSTNPKHGKRQEPTWRALHNLEPDLVGEFGWKIIHRPCAANKVDELSDYERSLLELWTRDDLMICEHDIVPKLDMLLTLAHCPHPLCAQAYRVMHRRPRMPLLDEIWRSGEVELPPRWKEIAQANTYLVTLPDGMVPIHRARTPGSTWKWRVIDEEAEWADYAGFGLARISVNFQREHPPAWEPGPWNDLDSRVSEWTIQLGYQWHIHYPEVEHNHRPTDEYQECQSPR